MCLRVYVGTLLALEDLLGGVPYCIRLTGCPSNLHDKSMETFSGYSRRRSRLLLLLLPSCVQVENATRTGQFETAKYVP